MTSAEDFGGIFIVLDVTTLAFAQIMRGIGLWETDWKVISSEGQVRLFTFIHVLEAFTRD